MLSNHKNTSLSTKFQYSYAKKRIFISFILEVVSNWKICSASFVLNNFKWNHKDHDEVISKQEEKTIFTVYIIL